MKLGNGDLYFDDWGVASDMTIPASSAPVADSGSSWFGNVDWSGALNTAISTWGNIEKTKTQLEIAKLQAQNPYASLRYGYGSTYYPGGGSVTYPSAQYPYGYSARSPLLPQQDNTMMLLLAGGAIIAGALILAR